MPSRSASSPRGTWMSSICPTWTRSVRRCFPRAWRYCWKWSRTSASTVSAWPKARCARDCSTISWAALPTKMRAFAACARWKSATTSTSCRRTVSRPRPWVCSSRSKTTGDWRIHWRSRYCAGPRGCTKPVSISPTRSITATAPTCSSTPTCRDFRAKNSCCSRRWWAVTAVNCRSSRSRTCCRLGIGWRSF